MKPIVLIAAAFMLAACGSLNPLTERRYTGEEYYYTENGVSWSCRLPAPWRGGNCRVDADWPDGGINE